MDKGQMKKIFKECAKVLSTYEGLLSEQAFDELSKIIVCKLYDEKQGKKQFKAIRTLEAINDFFEEAKLEFKGIFDPEEEIKLQQDYTIEKLTKLLQNLELYKSKEDIKGLIYETFLSEALRGELGQHLTPKEIIEFMSELVNPGIEDKVMDPAVGSGGLLLATLGKVRASIQNLQDFKEKIDNFKKNSLWGIDINPKMVKLCKLNLLIHGNGYQHIFNKDSLLEDMGESFDVILTNPPFNLRIENPKILKKYWLAKRKNAQESNILFLERCLQMLSESGRMAIILPEGLINNPKYEYVRDFICEKAIIKAVITLPSASFMPFGGSPANTCILYLQKKEKTKDKQKKAFMANPKFIGYEVGKKEYKPIKETSFITLLKKYRENNEDSESIWVNHEDIKSKRFDPRYYFNKYLVRRLRETYDIIKNLSEIALILTPKITPIKYPEEVFKYIEIPDISEETGEIFRFKQVLGKEVKGSKTRLEAGDIIFSRMYPDRRKIAIVPEEWKEMIIGSTEFYVIKPKENINKYFLYEVLRSDIVSTQVKNSIRGTSSSRPRINLGDLKRVKVPILNKEIQSKIGDEVKQIVNSLWSNREKLREIESKLKKIYRSYN